MEKKAYVTPEIEVVELEAQPVLAQQTGRKAPSYMDDGEFN
jgi:hypothetical protein